MGLLFRLELFNEAGKDRPQCLGQSLRLIGLQPDLNQVGTLNLFGFDPRHEFVDRLICRTKPLEKAGTLLVGKMIERGLENLPINYPENQRSLKNPHITLNRLAILAVECGFFALFNEQGAFDFVNRVGNWCRE